jgi:hypothetical protein
MKSYLVQILTLDLVIELQYCYAFEAGHGSRAV